MLNFLRDLGIRRSQGDVTEFHWSKSTGMHTIVSNDHTFNVSLVIGTYNAVPNVAVTYKLGKFIIFVDLKEAEYIFSFHFCSK